MLAQLRRPSENVANQLMALPWIALGLASVLSGTWIRFAPAPLLGALTLLAIILHPTGRGFFRSFRVSRVNRVMLALVIIAAVPLVAFASCNVAMQGSVANDHAGLGHYGFMAAFSFTLIGVASTALERSPRGQWSRWPISTAMSSGAVSARYSTRSLTPGSMRKVRVPCIMHVSASRHRGTAIRRRHVAPLQRGELRRITRQPDERRVEAARKACARAGVSRAGSTVTKT